MQEHIKETLRVLIIRMVYLELCKRYPDRFETLYDDIEGYKDMVISVTGEYLMLGKKYIYPHNFGGDSEKLGNDLMWVERFAYHVAKKFFKSIDVPEDAEVFCAKAEISPEGTVTISWVMK